MKTRYKVLILFVVVIAFFVIAIYSGFLSSGSYPYSENYKFHENSDSLISAIRTFKKNNPNFNATKEIGLIDSLDENNIFYNFWIYYPQQNEIVFFIVEGDYNDKNNSTLRLISVNSGLSLGHWRTINDDIGRTENLAQKKQFQTQVLDKLKMNYKDDGNNNFVFWK
jgi:lipopolysaccharide export LptBFGC system permease protein LptF